MYRIRHGSRSEITHGYKGNQWEGRGEEKGGSWEYMLKVPYILKCLIKQSTTCNEYMTAKILRNKKKKWSRARTKGAVCYLAASPRS